MADVLAAAVSGCRGLQLNRQFVQGPFSRDEVGVNIPTSVLQLQLYCNYSMLSCTTLAMSSHIWLDLGNC